MSDAKQRFLVTIKPDGSEVRVPFKRQPKYEALRDAVGGSIEGVKVRFDGRLRQAYVNEEGIYKRLEQNDRATQMFREANPYNSDVLLGNVVILA